MKPCLLCICNAGACRLSTSKTPKNMDRQYYKCEACNTFVKWADEVKADEFIYVPNCGGCTAGVCRVRKVNGRIRFSCRVKEGEGSCGYNVWQDELNTSALGQVDSNIVSPLSPNCCSNDTTCPPSGTGLANNSPANNTTSQDVIDPLPALIMAASKPPDCCVFPLSEPEVVVNQEPKSAESSTQSVGSGGGCNNNTFSETKVVGNGISKSVPTIFAKAAEELQNQLIVQLETMDPKDHEAMSHEVETAFTYLEKLGFNNQQFESRVNELIQCAKVLAEIEQSVPGSDSFNKLTSEWYGKRTEIEKIVSNHNDAADIVIKEEKRLKLMKDNIDKTKKWIVKAEAEVSSFEDELRNMKQQLEKVSKDKEVVERKLEDLKKHGSQREEAKAAFDRARSLLRG